jgi:hypothetical protein
MLAHGGRSALAAAPRSAGGRSGPIFPLRRGPLGPYLPASPGAARALCSPPCEPATNTPRSEPRGISRPAVDNWLTAHVDGATAPFDYKLIAAGGSNLTFRVTDDAGINGPCAVRPTDTPCRPRTTCIASTDSCPHWPTAPVPVPACIAYCDDNSVTGSQFYVMSFVDGHILRDRLRAPR